MDTEKNKDHHKKFVFGNERFGGSYTPGDFQFNFPDDMTREEFEKMFTSKMHSLYKMGNDFREELFDNASKSRKENLKPLSIRVKPHTKEFFKNHSILSPRDVLEMYENFNNSSEAFINSLIEDEKELEKELAEVQEKLHNAKLFREKLSEMEPQKDVLTDEDALSKLKQEYEHSEIRSLGNETSPQKAQSDIIRTVQIYNTLTVHVYDSQVMVIEVYTNAVPVIYYFKNEYSKEDIKEILNQIGEYCSKHDISFDENASSLFE